MFVSMAFPLRPRIGTSTLAIRAPGILLLIGAALWPVAATAGTMRIIPTESNIPTYVDTGSLVRSGQTVELIYVTDFRTATPSPYDDARFRSEATRVSINCANRTAAVKAISSYADRAASGNRTSSETLSGEAAKPAPIERKSTLDYVAKFACSGK